MMRRKILPFILGGALAIGAVAPAAAAHNTQHQAAGAAAGLVAAVVQVQVRDVSVAVLNNSLNNFLQGANIEVAKNILNNSEVLSRNTIVITDIQVIDDSTIIVSVLSGGVNLGDITLTAPGA